jgi:hydroxymethylpyrimidine/phosphomethylpyrimidine kinase
LADVRAFERAGAFGCAATAVVTVQSVAGLVSVTALPSALVARQIAEVLLHQDVRAIKIGALGTAANVRAVARALYARKDVPVVLDTPMSPTRGRASLMDARAAAALARELLPVASLVTVNVDEARAVLALSKGAPFDPRDAARAIARLGPRAVLVKGGHARGPRATDVLFVGGEVIEIDAPRLAVGAVHGTGCTLASLVAGRLACRAHRRAGEGTLIDSVRWAKRIHHAAMARAMRVGRGMKVLAFEGTGRRSPM